MLLVGILHYFFFHTFNYPWEFLLFILKIQLLILIIPSYSFSLKTFPEFYFFINIAENQFVFIIFFLMFRKNLDLLFYLDSPICLVYEFCWAIFASFSSAILTVKNTLVFDNLEGIECKWCRTDNILESQILTVFFQI